MKRHIHGDDKHVFYVYKYAFYVDFGLYSIIDARYLKIHTAKVCCALLHCMYTSDTPYVDQTVAFACVCL